MSRGTDWQADLEKTKGIQFAGAPDLLGLIIYLCRRPWRLWAERRLPVIRLIRPATSAVPPDPLGGLNEWLTQANIPYVLVATVKPPVKEGERPDDLQAERQAVRVEDLLDAAVTGLAEDFRGNRPIRFPHYGLALWLLHLEEVPADIPVDQKRRKIAERLNTHIRTRLPDNQMGARLADAVGDFPWWVRLTARTVPWLGLILMRASWRPPRWFARQKIAKPYQGSFDRLALAFADGTIKAHDDARVDRLLVDAFLRDLRVAYRRSTFLGAGRRRTAYPVLLLSSGVDKSTELLDLIRTARSKAAKARHRRDPLLVITDPQAVDGQAATTPPDDAEPAYRTWQSNQLSYRSGQTATLDFGLPSGAVPPGAWRDLSAVGLPRRRRPWMSLVLPVLLLAGLAVAGFANDRRCEPLWSTDTHTTLQQESLDAGRSECIGLSDGNYRFFDDPPGADRKVAADLRAVESTIAATNAEVVENADHVSVVFLSTLTNTTIGGYQAALEELRGLAIAQREFSHSDVPIRLLLANGGDEMNHGKRAAELIAGAATRLRIVAVTGLGVSREGVKEALLQLDAAGIPMLGTLLSADQLTRLAANYHQVGPTNEREAAVAAYYAKAKKGITQAAIYYSGDPDDLYSVNLAEDLRKAFQDQKIAVTDYVAYRAGANETEADVTILGRDACPARKGYLVVFAGRPDEFGRFLLGMRGNCPAAYPMLLGGDALTEFVLSGRLADFPGLPLDYLTPASGVAWGPRCETERKPVHFFTLYHKAGYGPACDTGQAARAMFGYDALGAIQAAIVQVRALNGRNPVRPGSVAQGLSALSGTSAFAGVTGKIDFTGRGGGRQVPVDKAMLVLGGEAATLRLLCGEIPTARAPDRGCPSDRNK